MMMALSILALVAASTFAAMSQANRFAITNRVYTCAQTLVQNQIDTFLSVGPFYPQSDLIPAELATGTNTTNNIPIYADTASAASIDDDIAKRSARRVRDAVSFDRVVI